MTNVIKKCNNITTFENQQKLHKQRGTLFRYAYKENLDKMRFVMFNQRLVKVKFASHTEVVSRIILKLFEVCRLPIVVLCKNSDSG